MSIFFSGMVTMGFLVAALFFLRFIDWTLELNRDERALFAAATSACRRAA